MKQFDWQRFQAVEPGDGWIELEDSTWDALISAVAGPSNVVRQPRSQSPLSPSDQEIVDDAIDDYLAAASIPARPRGYTWHIRPPQKVGGLRQLHQNLNKYISDVNPNSSSPTELRDVVASYVNDFLS